MVVNGIAFAQTGGSKGFWIHLDMARIIHLYEALRALETHTARALADPPADDQFDPIGVVCDRILTGWLVLDC